MQKRLFVCLTVAALTLATSAARAQTTYSNAVLTLNPAGYWPLTEAILPPSADYVATNLGTAGAAGNGFYETWYQPNGTSFYPTNNIQHTTAAAPIGDNDTALLCTKGPGQYVVFPRSTNGVPNPAITIQPPFSIEFWVTTASLNNGVTPFVNEGRAPVMGDASVNYAPVQKGFSIGQWKYLFYFAIWNGTGGDSTKQEIDINPVQPNTWYHVVATFDGATAFLYTNGLFCTSARFAKKNPAGQIFAVDTTSPLLIGTGSIIGAGYGGSESQATLDEVAIYTNVLTADQVAAHYAATTGNYATSVLADSPVIYLRLDEPAFTNYPSASTYPVANNYGSLGAVGNGLYQPGTTPGVAGPPFAGFGTSSRAVAINGFNGAVDIGGGNLPAAFNPTNSTPFTVTAWFQGNPADALTRYQEIVGHGAASSWRLGLDDNSGGAVFNPGNGPTLQFANTLDVVSNVMVMNDGQWHMAAAVSDGANASLYLDGVLAKTASGVGAISGNALDLMIGGDPQFMVPLANGDHNTEPRFFDGQVAQVAWFTNALTAAQIQQLYGAAGVPPFIASQPSSQTNNAGATVTLTMGVRGSSPINYQWYQNGAAVPSATSSSLTFASVTPANAGSYFAVANNSYGAVTSAVVQLTVYGTPTIQDQSLTSLKVFAGTSPTLRLTAIGPAPLNYQWTLNGSPLAGATSANYVVTNVQSGGSYGCTVSNAYGSASITPIALSVVPAPTAAYPAAVLADKPLAFYRLDEPSGTVAYDYVGGLNATYTNVLLGQMPGYNPNDPSEPAAVFGNLSPSDSYAGNVPVYLNFAAPAGSHSEFSVEAWVNGGFGQTTDAGIVTLGYGNGGEQFNLDAGGADPQHNFRFFVRDAAGSVHAATGTVGPNDNAWHHVVAVCDEAAGKVELYVDGALNASGNIGTTNGILASTTPLSIGARQSGNGTAFDDQFIGSLNEVAIYNYALSASQVLAHYYASGVAPAITVQPTNTTVDQGATAQIVAAASGTPPLAYQWYDVTMGSPVPVSGQTNATLAIANIPSGDNGHTFQLTVTNLYGQATSDPAQLTVVSGAPALLADLQPLTATVNEGTPVSYSVSVSGSAPLVYQWTQDGVAITGATNSTYAFAALAGTNTYAVTVSNSLGSVTSSTATLIGLPVPKLDPTAYTYKLKIGFPGYNRNVSLSNFPALVTLSTNVAGFAYQQFALTNGGDLRFTDASGDRMIPFEIDQWNDTNGVSSVWVSVPTLSSTNDFIWAYWGNATPTNALSSTNVWVPNYTLVWHMKEGALPFADSTSQFPATGGMAPATAPGIVGLGGSFAGSAYLDPGAVNLGDAFSLYAWVKIASTADNIQAVWVNSKGGWNANGCQFFVNTYNTHDGVLHCNTGDGSNGNDTVTAAGAVSTGQWHLLTAVVNRTGGKIRLYVDGADATASGGVVTDFGNQSDLNLGRFTDSAFPMNGVMDEVRIASSTNSPAWVWASYMTVAANSSFESYSGVNGAAGVSLSLQVSAGKPVLTWPQGTLQAAGQLGGSWTNVPGATSPYTVPLSGAQQFYRLQVP